METRKPANIEHVAPPATPDAEAEANNDQTLDSLATLADLAEGMDLELASAALAVAKTSSGIANVDPFDLRFAESLLTIRRRSGKMAPIGTWINASATAAQARKGIKAPVSRAIDDDVWEAVVKPALYAACDKLGIKRGQATGQWSFNYVKVANMTAPIRSRGKFRIAIHK